MKPALPVEVRPIHLMMKGVGTVEVAVACMHQVRSNVIGVPMKRFASKPIIHKGKHD